jgi:DNA polymerase-4
MSARFWLRAIVHVDMNAFFASVEQRDFPALRGRPVGVTNGTVGATLITCSYEARAKGVKTGMRLYEARKLCPELIQRPARPRVYAEISTRIMRALTTLSPDVEVFSVDEAFIDVTHCQRLYGSPEHIGRMVKARVHEASDGLPCSVGIAGAKSTAKIASELVKPNGFTVIPPWEARERLKDIPMRRLCGLGPAIATFLERYGARTCGDVAALPLSILERRFGVTGKYLWLACQGEDTAPVRHEVAPPKSVGHGKVLPPRTADRDVIETYLRHMCEKVAARLRRYALQAGRLYVGLRCPELGDSPGETYALARGMPDGGLFFAHARRFLAQHWCGEAVTHVQVTATDLRSTEAQLDLFAPVASGAADRAGAVDRINLKYGEFTVSPATLLARSEMPNVIAPAWRPDGWRQYLD